MNLLFNPWLFSNVYH